MKNGVKQAAKSEQLPLKVKLPSNAPTDKSSSEVLEGPGIWILCKERQSIPRSRQNPKILGVDDSKIVGDRITEVGPISGNRFAQEGERRVGELSASCVAFVVGDMLVHDAP